MQADDRFLALSLDGVLEQILRFLPQSERLGTCTLVCKRWAAAAVSVTAQEGLLLQPCNALSEAWLGQNGAGLQALVVKTGSICGDGVTSSIAGLQQLTRLELNSVTSKPVLLQAAGNNMKDLQHLCLINLCWGPLISTSSREELAAAARVLWEGCTKLTYLQAEQCDLDDACVTSLCCSLPHLRTLDLSHNSLSDPRSLGCLPAALTALFLGGNSEYLEVTTLLQPSNSTGTNSSSGARGRQQQGPGVRDSQAADFPGHTAAERNEPSSCNSHADSSSSTSGWLQELRALDISSLTLRQPQVLADLTSLTWLNVDDTAMPHPSDLLAALPRLLELQQLNMMGCFGGRRPTTRAADLSVALSPLTQLTALDIGNNTLSNGSDDAPAGVWEQEQGGQSVRSARQHLFAGLLLPRLQVLGVSDMCYCSPGCPLFLAEDLGHLVAACPALTWLRMQRSLVLKSERDLSPLSALAGSLTRLDLSMHSHFQVLQDEHLQHIAKLQGLSVLEISGVGELLSDRGLLALTALTGLASLHLADITSEDISQEVLPTRGRKGVRAPPGDVLLLQTKLSKHGCVSASVSQQLKERCAKSPQLWRELQQELKEELKAAKQDAKNARKEAAAERKKTSAAQKQARKAQKQAAAAQDEVAALRQQLEEMQAQLQQTQSQETGSQ